MHAAATLVAALCETWVGHRVCPALGATVVVTVGLVTRRNTVCDRVGGRWMLTVAESRTGAGVGSATHVRPGTEEPRSAD